MMCSRTTRRSPIPEGLIKLGTGSGTLLSSPTVVQTNEGRIEGLVSSMFPPANVNSPDFDEADFVVAASCCSKAITPWCSVRRAREAKFWATRSRAAEASRDVQSAFNAKFEVSDAVESISWNNGLEFKTAMIL